MSGSKVWVKSTHSAVLIVVIGPTMDNLSYVSPRKSNIRIKEGENSISPSHVYLYLMRQVYFFFTFLRTVFTSTVKASFTSSSLRVLDHSQG